MVGRKYTATSGAEYRFGFNGKEKASEISSDDYDFGARVYDGRLGRWLSVDPLEFLYPNKSPYHFVSNNPINRIDPLGLTDYKVNGENKTINDGHNDVSIKVSAKEFESLQKKFDKGGSGYERYMNKLSVKNGFTTFGTFGETFKDINGVVNLKGIIIEYHRGGKSSYSEWSISNRDPYYPYVENFFRTLDAGVGSVTGQFGNINVSSKGNKWHYRQNNGRIFNGNQYVTTTAAATKYAKFAKGAKIGGAVTGIALGAYEVYQGYQQDGGKFGYNAQVQTAGAVGGIAGGAVGAEAGATVGAAIGVWFGGVGAVPGAIIGGLIGGAIGAWTGDYYGEQAAKSIIK
jgi:RHS repeat-associated protein